ncbi:MAG: thiamine phosphate synthase [Gammaproteobacteria bacterium]|nr:thiamine phosphate synthase [Gammaproteobacteria bacterium]MBU2057467.1 thiamine phosphate synthase [Gammaproteobacteria bacterium]MBU2176227.1 thiamine phosphate synthase [Gammaproteobacteria bacterium]MBU2245828.1 thiamine phosphate synthase [Gammaproteobacteria bacterium]MBU2343102.1 thiamine phosphate synthase [Gammaproteobacteria bacterium]
MIHVSNQATILWSIAGSDNSAGAGIQADLKTIQSFSTPEQPLHLCTLVTAITAQHSSGVDSCMAVSVAMLHQQAMALLKDATPAVIKIGLLVNKLQVLWLAEFLQELRQQHTALLVIYDPVALSSSGSRMADADLYQAVMQHLLPQLDLLTPNLPELEALTKAAPCQQAVQQLFEFGVKAVLVKGGHDFDTQSCTDQLFISPQFSYRGYPAYSHQISLRSPRQQHQFNHGTGCCFSSALAAALALGYALEDAFVVAKSYINQGLSQPVVLTDSSGTLGHWGFPAKADYLPQLLTDNLLQPVKAFAPLKAPLGLYVIVPSVAELQRALTAGVKTLQLRIKSTDQALLRQEIQQAIQLCQHPDLQLFINDHWQLALELGAYGVHLGQEDINSTNLAALQQAGLRLGLSSHGFYKLLRAQQLKPSYLAIGAVFATQTKEMGGKLQGLQKLARYPALFPTTPLVAIGGINQSNAKAVLACGIQHLAVVQAFATAAEPKLWVQQMQQLIAKAQLEQKPC